MRDRCEKERKRDTALIETRKKVLIKQMMQKHNEKFFDIKEYYKDITRANLDKIKTLKDDIGHKKDMEKTLEKEVREKARGLKRPEKLKKIAKEEYEQLSQDEKIFKQEEKDLLHTKEILAALEEKLKNLSWEHEILDQKKAQLAKEKDALEKKLETTIYSIQQKTGFQNLILEKKLEAMAIDLQKTEAALAEVILRVYAHSHYTYIRSVITQFIHR